MTLASDWETFLNTLSPKFYVALTATSSVISGLILLGEWLYFQKYGVSFIEQFSLNHIGPLFGGESVDQRETLGPMPEVKVWRNPMNLLRGAEYQRYTKATGKQPLTFHDLNISSMDHQDYFGIDNICDDVEDLNMMHLALREPDPALRVKMAREVLALNPECVLALIIIAEEEAETVLESEKFFKEALAIAEAASPKKKQEMHRRDVNIIFYIKRRLGMIARKLGKNKEAAKIFRDLLKEHPAFINLFGIHENLIEVMLETQAYADAQALLVRYEDIGLPKSATISYTNALLKIRAVLDKFCPIAAAKRGLSPLEAIAVDAVHRAVEFNPHVSQYLLEMKPLILPTEHILKRGDTEAIAYAFAHLQHWKRVEGALPFLQATWETTFRALPYPMERGRFYHTYPVEVLTLERDFLPDDHPLSVYPKREIPFLIVFTALLCLFTAGLAFLINYYPLQMGHIMKSAFVFAISPFFFMFEKVESFFPSNFMQTLSRV